MNKQKIIDKQYEYIALLENGLLRYDLNNPSFVRMREELSSLKAEKEVSECDHCEGCHSLGSEYCAQSCKEDQNFEKSIKSLGDNWDKLKAHRDNLIKKGE